MFKLIPLRGKGQHEALVDERDFEWLSRMKWNVVRTSGNQVYAVTSKQSDGKRKWFKMHRLIALPEKGQPVDHINGDTLDNRRSNLRVCSHSDNVRNSLSQKKHSVCKLVGRRRKPFWARLGKTSLGTFSTIPEAQAAIIAAKAIRDAELSRWRNLHCEAVR